jgi:hypothetical protein
MNKAVFIVSHLFSGSHALCEKLETTQRVSSFSSNATYKHYDDFRFLVGRRHKINNAAATYLDELIYNHSFSFKPLYEYCKFIYVIREAKPTINGIITHHNLKQQSALRYYSYRLRRLCEMARNTPNSLLVTWDDIITGKCISPISEMLNLKSDLDTNFNLKHYKEVDDKVHYKIIEQGQESYERHFMYLKSKLRTC